MQRVPRFVRHGLWPCRRASRPVPAGLREAHGAESRAAPRDTPCTRKRWERPVPLQSHAGGTGKRAGTPCRTRAGTGAAWASRAGRGHGRRRGRVGRWSPLHRGVGETVRGRSSRAFRSESGSKGRFKEGGSPGLRMTVEGGVRHIATRDRHAVVPTRACRVAEGRSWWLVEPLRPFWNVCWFIVRSCHPTSAGRSGLCRRTSRAITGHERPRAAKHVLLFTARWRRAAPLPHRPRRASGREETATP
jgi:hypothetical protein